MGGKGAKLVNGKYERQLWKTDESVKKICGIKVLKRIDGGSVSLPYCSVKPGTSYISLRKDGMFDQLRVYGMDKLPLFDIEYGKHRGKKSLHVHFFENGKRLNPTILSPGDNLYEKYRLILNRFGL